MSEYCIYPNQCGIGADCSECMGAEITRLRAKLAEEEIDHGKDITERDYWENKATELANDIGEALGFDVGEHSNMNCPVQSAIDGVAEMRSQIDGWQKLAEAEGQEPVAEVTQSGFTTTLANMRLPVGTKLYTHPAPAKVPDKLKNAIEHYKWCMENEVCSSIRYESKIKYDTLCYVEAMLKSQGGE